MLERANSLKNAGFTVIELIIIIIILAVLAVTATTRLANFGSEARINVIKMLRGSFEEQHRLLDMKVKMPGILQPLGSQFYADLNEDGTFTPDSNTDQNDPEGKDSPDILLMSDQMIDNYQVMKLLDLSEDLIVELGPQRHQAYIGFDLDGDGLVRQDFCRVYYDQRRFQMRTDGC